MGSAYKPLSVTFNSTSFTSQSVDLTVDVAGFLNKLNSAGYTLLPNDAVFYDGWVWTALSNSIALVLEIYTYESNTSYYGICYMEPPSSGDQLTFTYT